MESEGLSSVLLELLIIVVLMIFKGFFSGSEIAIVNSDKIKMRHLAKQGKKGAALVLKRFRAPDIILGTTLVGTNIATVGVSTLGTLLFIGLFGQGGDVLAVLFLSPFMLIFGEIVPKSIYQQKANTLAPIIIYPLTLMTYLFYPVIFVFSRFARFFTKLVSGKSTTRSPYITREEIRTLLEIPDSAPERKDDNRRFDKERVRSIIRYAETSVGSSMRPLADVMGIEENEGMEEAVRMVLEKGYDRIPVYRENLTNIVGTLTLKSWDLMDPEIVGRKITELMQPPIFVTPRQTIHEVLPQLQHRVDRMAVVVDEFGSADGVLFVEDIFMEVIGGLDDAMLASTGNGGRVALFEQTSEDEYRVSGRFPITQLNESLSLSLPTDEGFTVAGLLVNRLRSIPQPGSTLTLEGCLFIVQETDDRSITQVCIQRI